ncbi:MAG TPA: 3-dehydroquinate synthase family protein [Bacteroidales bacterium]|nr:3-dehydroquinate synthase family protein [Bacteroidales bacterium]
MKRITINTGKQNSEILIGGKWTDAFLRAPRGKTIIIADENVAGIYGKDFGPFPVITVAPGEKGKNFATVEELASRLLETGLGRDGFILAIGGGVVCDIAGFLASIYMRGIRSGFVSSSLLSQVDASIGGKNGVNLRGVKNILGVFSQPEFVICDPSMLRTLPEDEFLSGLAEVIKMGAILSRPLLELLITEHDAVLDRMPWILENLVYESVRLKAEVVSRDEREAGERKILNFGHTFGHVIEAVSGEKHGIAVASGMAVALDISRKEGILDDAGYNFIYDILKSYRLLTGNFIPPGMVEKYLVSDKKRKGRNVSFVLVSKPGSSEIREIDVKQLVDYYKQYVA